MNLQELMWHVGLMSPLAKALALRAAVGGGVPIGEGRDRIVAGFGATWVEGSVATSFTIEAGLAGDPFILRGLLESAVRF
jgi:hypothetical protein